MSTGRLFNTTRLSREKYEEYQKEVCDILSSHGIRFFIPFYYDDKKTFGDIDFIIPRPFDKSDIVGMFRFNKTEYNHNSNVHSIRYKNFQIDFITTNPSQFETTKDYYSWSDLSILIGRMYKKFNIKYGWDGLTYEYDTKLNSQYKNIGRLKLSTDFSKILEFLGLDYSIFLKGFKTKSEVFDFILTSKYFTPKIFEAFYNKKRKRSGLYDEIIEYSKDKTYSLKTDSFFSNKDEVYRIIDNYFSETDFLKFITDLKQKEKIIQVNKDKYNGRIVMALTGLKDKELSNFMVSFKKYVKENYGYDVFNIYVYDTSTEHIQRDIKVHLNEFISI